jgi:GTP-binding protein
MVRLSGDRSFVVADIPGLIEGAHEGAGLGDRFLRHVERTRVLVHLLDATAGPDRAPLRDFDAINRELAAFDPELANRPQIVVLNKLDLPDVEAVRKRLTSTFARRKIKLHAISAATGAGVPALLEEVWKVIAATRKASAGTPPGQLSTGTTPVEMSSIDSSADAVRPKGKSSSTPRARPPKPPTKTPAKTPTSTASRRPARSRPRPRQH